MRFVIVTGLSGAGKSQSVKYMEDMGFYCVDNIPPTLIENFLKICIQAGFKKVALVTDIRGGEMFSQSIDIIKELKNSEYNLEILFLQASDDTLVNRYNFTRRRHPLISSDNTVIEAIREERKTLSEIEKFADNTIDTSNLYRGEAIVSNLRHFEALEAAYAALTAAADALANNISSELLAEDIRIAIHHIGEITGGTISSDSVLQRIFSSFCIGK